ncbi:MAG: hypothetical protein HY297_05000, partial [Thaumarchaeota archaeon]|nr:hypothetical protein [Nitrososphaerota archaeon]
AAGGIDRIALSLASEPTEPSDLVYVAAIDERAGREAVRILHELRSAGVAADSALKPKGLSKQLEDASAKGASWAIILGEKEIAAKKVTLRDLKNRTESLTTMEDAIKRIRRV